MAAKTNQQNCSHLNPKVFNAPLPTVEADWSDPEPQRMVQNTTEVTVQATSLVNAAIEAWSLPNGIDSIPNLS